VSTKTDEQAAKLINAIKTDIIVGHLRPREHLVEDEIASKFGVSRHIVRAALAGLEQMGLIIRRPNRGSVVRDFSVDQVEEIYEVRMILQAEAARRLTFPAGHEDVQELRDIHARYCEALDAGDLIEVNVLNDAFHRRIWRMCPNKYLAETIEKLWIETTGIRWYHVGDVNLLANSRKDHQAMIDSLEEGDRDRFVALAVDHIMPPLAAFRRAHGAVATGGPAATGKAKAAR
jgi:DNA-binding GntR family transcriptional regulator